MSLIYSFSILDRSVHVQDIDMAETDQAQMASNKRPHTEVDGQGHAEDGECARSTTDF